MVLVVSGDDKGDAILEDVCVEVIIGNLVFDGDETGFECSNVIFATRSTMSSTCWGCLI